MSTSPGSDVQPACIDEVEARAETFLRTAPHPPLELSCLQCVYRPTVGLRMCRLPGAA